MLQEYSTIETGNPTQPKSCAAGNTGSGSSRRCCLVSFGWVVEEGSCAPRLQAAWDDLAGDGSCRSICSRISWDRDEHDGQIFELKRLFITLLIIVVGKRNKGSGFGNHAGNNGRVSRPVGRAWPFWRT